MHYDAECITTRNALRREMQNTDKERTTAGGDRDKGPGVAPIRAKRNGAQSNQRVAQGKSRGTNVAACHAAISMYSTLLNGQLMASIS